MGVSAIFNRHRNHYGSLGFVAGLSRVVLMITSLVLAGLSASDISLVTMPNGTRKFDTIELFGLILGAVTMVYTLLGLVPGTYASPVRRLFEFGLLLIVLYVAYLVGAALTPGYMPNSYVAPGASKESKIYSNFIAGAISGGLVLLNTILDFIRRKGPPGFGAYEDEEVLA